MSDQNSGSGFFTGLLVGATVGAGLALLYAPRSGKDTRKLLVRKTQDLQKQAIGIYEDGKEVIHDKAQQLVDATARETNRAARHNNA